MISLLNELEEVKGGIKHKLFKSPSTRALILGKTGAGKTYTTLALFVPSMDINEIFLFGPEGIFQNPTYQRFIKTFPKTPTIITITSPEILRQIPERSKFMKAKNLLIFDDISPENYKALKSLFSKSRQYNVSSFILCQSLNYIPVDMRDNATDYVIFKGINQPSQRRMLADLTAIDKKRFNVVVDSLPKYQYIRTDTDSTSRFIHEKNDIETMTGKPLTKIDDDYSNTKPIPIPDLFAAMPEKKSLIEENFVTDQIAGSGIKYYIDPDELTQPEDDLKTIMELYQGDGIDSDEMDADSLEEVDALEELIKLYE